MNSVRCCCIVVIAVVLCVTSGTAAQPCYSPPAPAGYTPHIPAGYSPKVVLHVDYGDTPDRIGVEWGGGPEGLYRDPASATNVRVIRGKVYLIDSVTETIKQYRSPGVLVWASDRLDNLGYYAVASDGKVYALWGSRLDQLSCLDPQGKMLWTKSLSEDLTREKSRKLSELGLRSWLPGLGPLEWTPYGLTVRIIGDLDDGTHGRFALTISNDGVLQDRLTGTIVEGDGTIYDYKLGNQWDQPFTSPITGKDRKGAKIREIKPQQGKDGIHGVGRVAPDPAGGLIIDGHTWLSEKVGGIHGTKTNLEEVMWRVGHDGKIKEEWRFLSDNPFGSRARQVVVGDDGNVYHLKFSETGIDVVKYQKK